MYHLCISKIFFLNQIEIHYQDIFLISDIDECSMAVSVCLHGGSCINTDGGYICQCPIQWFGDNCEFGK